MTPKTGSGRALLAKKHRAIPTSESGERYRDETLAAILAIEQEAASKAVAEVLDRLEGQIMAMRIEGGFGPRSIAHNMAIARVAALIASEREP